MMKCESKNYVKWAKKEKMAAVAAAWKAHIIKIYVKRKVGKSEWKRLKIGKKYDINKVRAKGVEKGAEAMSKEWRKRKEETGKNWK